MTSFAARYLEKNKIVPVITSLPEQSPRLIIVIPCYKEPDLLRSLQSLFDCRRPAFLTEVIVVINHPEDASEAVRKQNEKSLRDALSWVGNHPDPRLQFHIIYCPDLPVKDAGVGLARKTGMDEALYRFARFGTAQGIIAGFDADSVCDSNYLEEIGKAFEDPKVNGASIYYEHPTEGTEFDRLVYDGIIQYELHLRYLNQAMRYTSFPYSYHTVGSSFAVRASAYAKQGGMNKRKAGEDFHFLHKIMPLGYTGINTTRVIPSPRLSDRVPFGTGASIRQWVGRDEKALYTYAIDPFLDLKKLFSAVPSFFRCSQDTLTGVFDSLSPPLQEWLVQMDYLRNIAQVDRNSATQDAFVKRFFSWFNALEMVKFLNFSTSWYPRQPSFMAAGQLVPLLGYRCPEKDAAGLLGFYRSIERGRMPETCMVDAKSLDQVL